MLNTLIPLEKKERNYQLDFLKLVFSIFVFIAHTIYITPNTISKNPLFGTLGFVAVFYFFIVSGMMMLNSKTQIETVTEAGSTALGFVFHRIGNIITKYYIALLFSISSYIYIYIYIYMKKLLKQYSNAFLKF
jgi:peptidoglycan/LPS O-acetylase OafA/YrhL